MSFSELSEYSYSLLVKGTPLTAAKKSPPLSLSAMNSAASSSSAAASSFKGHNVHRQCTIRVIQADKKTTSSGKIEFVSRDNVYISTTSYLKYNQNGED